MDEKLFKLIPQVDLSSEENIKKFKAWQHEDVTVEGLQELLDEQNIPVNTPAYRRDIECPLCKHQEPKKKVMIIGGYSMSGRKSGTIQMLLNNVLTDMQVIHRTPDEFKKEESNILRDADKLILDELCGISPDIYEAIEKAIMADYSRTFEEELYYYNVEKIPEEQCLPYDENRPKKKKRMTRMEKQYRYGGK